MPTLIPPGFGNGIGAERRTSSITRKTKRDYLPMLAQLKDQVLGRRRRGSSRGNPPPADLEAALPYPTVEHFFWRPRDGRSNFGDQLSRVVVELMLARQGRTLSDEARRPTQMLAIGSVLHFARDHAVVWGSGINGKIAPERHQFQSLDVRAARGPLTREFLAGRGITAPEVYGDPALLLPMLAGSRFKAKAERPVAFVPNLNDMSKLAGVDLGGLPVISPLRSWNRCVEEILSHRFVLASSLHGIIVAEAYGIPARYVRLSEEENLFKYRDYYAGTGRQTLTFARSVAEGLEMGGEQLPDFDPAPLANAFPYDLWL